MTVQEYEALTPYQKSVYRLLEKLLEEIKALRVDSTI